MFVLAFAGAVILSSQQAAIPTQQQQAEQSETKNQNKENDKTLWDTWFPESISLYTLLLTIFTAVLAGAGLIQLNLLGRAERVAAESAKAAKQSADAARDSVKLAERIAERQLRAYLTISETYISDIRSEFPPKAWFQIKNSGQTPAYAVRNFAKVTVKPFPFQGPFDVDLNEPGSGAVIGPGNSVTNNISFSGLPKEAIPMIANGTAALYFFGEIHYRDAFKKSHWIRFRLYHGGDRPVGEGGLNGAQEGNEADDQ